MPSANVCLARAPRLVGEVERRLLVNYRVEPAVIEALLPARFRPQIVNGFAVAGICLIRMGSLRPRGLPAWLGLRSENAAHRFAVEWDGPDGIQRGVYIPRRDSDSLISAAVGGRLYPARLHRASFDVAESGAHIRIAFAARDRSARAAVDVTMTDELTGSALFADIDAASAFFEGGSKGYSATADPGRFDGLALQTTAWKVHPAIVTSAASSFFDDPTAFPPGSADLDCALIMRRIPVTWQPLPQIGTPQPTRVQH
jgi:uncharacterized protein YqjF (DUF2071 family)